MLEYTANWVIFALFIVIMMDVICLMFYVECIGECQVVSASEHTIPPLGDINQFNESDILIIAIVDTMSNDAACSIQPTQYSLDNLNELQQNSISSNNTEPISYLKSIFKVNFSVELTC